MNKVEIETILKRKKDLFIQLDISFIIDNSLRVETNKIYKLTLNKELFSNFNILDNNLHYSIFIAIVDKKENSVLQTSNINANFKDNQIVFNIFNINNNKSLDNYTFYISVIPIEQRNEDILKYLMKYFYNPVSILPKIKRVKNFIGVISVLTLLFTIFFTILQVYITNELINNYGFVDNIINNFSIFNASVSYLYGDFIYTLISVLSLTLTILFVFIAPCLFSLIIDSFKFIYFDSCLVDKNKYLYHVLRLKMSYLDFKNSLKVLTTNFLSKATLGLFIFIVVTFIPVYKFISDLNLNLKSNFKGKIIEKYFDYSAFPNFVKLEYLNCSEDKVFMIGYDSTYMYYYDYNYIKNILNKKFKPFKYNNEDDYREISFSELYVYNLNQLSKKELKYIKNTDYKILEIVQEKFYVLKDDDTLN
ncbi:hypothetical protein CRU92_05805 [Arcobacter sp. FW59]|nr:hypothetical protein CRU92_05805 [Arcobacter sp. FW59]